MVDRINARGRDQAGMMTKTSNRVRHLVAHAAHDPDDRGADPLATAVSISFFSFVGCFRERKTQPVTPAPSCLVSALPAWRYPILASGEPFFPLPTSITTPHR